jgi:Protein of unknown function (DUF3617)
MLLPEPAMRRAFSITAALLLLASPALAAGKAGLWTVTTSWQFSPPVVPAVLAALARQQGIAPPRNGQPFVHHMCMTPYEAEGRDPLHFNSRDYDCVPRIVSFRRPLMVMETVCHGQVEGVGRSRITWRGDDHFEGSYAFTGKFRGDPARITSSFSADWAGSDCRGVRVFIPQQP